jgi:hypothetical protein
VSEPLKIGDRVCVTMRRRKILYETEPFWRGKIVGESRDRTCWIVRRDLYECPTAYHKSFCSKEVQPPGTEG